VKTINIKQPLEKKSLKTRANFGYLANVPKNTNSYNPQRLINKKEQKFKERLINLIKEVYSEDEIYQQTYNSKEEIIRRILKAFDESPIKYQLSDEQIKKAIRGMLALELIIGIAPEDG
jgi:hypothetical protein